ncbi:unnamed protein product [Schistocephalus solidus]|uniref:Uncharacterized protein n=1 Tax=Schistocephalus solidus TaxID=70667 RepID=A0A183TJ65_SCHSO|nr:unnamed protein product [Schistocephalus solidus]
MCDTDSGIGMRTSSCRLRLLAPIKSPHGRPVAAAEVTTSSPPTPHVSRTLAIRRKRHQQNSLQQQQHETPALRPSPSPPSLFSPRLGCLRAHVRIFRRHVPVQGRPLIGRGVMINTSSSNQRRDTLTELRSVGENSCFLGVQGRPLIGQGVMINTSSSNQRRDTLTELRSVGENSCFLGLNWSSGMVFGDLQSTTWVRVRAK